jgi:hypothetical protein
MAKNKISPRTKEVISPAQVPGEKYPTQSSTLLENVIFFG